MPADVPERLRQYAAGRPVDEIADAHGVTTAAVYTSMRRLVARTRGQARYWGHAEAVRAMSIGTFRDRAHAAVAFLEISPELRRQRDEERRRREAELEPARETEWARAIEELKRMASEP